jgi:hypothetical protein
VRAAVLLALQAKQLIEALYFFSKIGLIGLAGRHDRVARIGIGGFGALERVAFRAGALIERGLNGSVFIAREDCGAYQLGIICASGGDSGR